MRQCGVEGRGLEAEGAVVPFEIRMKFSSFDFVVVEDWALLANWAHANSHCLDWSKSRLMELAVEWLRWPRRPLMD